MPTSHHYTTKLTWTGNSGSGTKTYSSSGRNHIISIEGKDDIAGSSDPAFRGDKSRYNPEELLVASLSSCHMLWFLHLCSAAGIVVTNYKDEAKGTMIETADGGGHFTEVILYPVVTIEGKADKEKLDALQHEANKKCFIAASCNFPVRHEARYVEGEG
ncbi:MAG: OsmC family protein [Chitinophagaceae bacterium]|nr:OsmC family protein [Chitinophagaceae bacterium]